MSLLTFEKSVGVIIFRLNNLGEREFLLLHYPSGHWDFPKGHVEKNETEAETLRRETEEETGIKDLKILPKFRKNIYYFYRAKGQEKENRLRSGKSLNIFKRVVFYLAETHAPEVIISFEHINYAWLSGEETHKRLTFANPKKMFQKAQIFLG